MYVFEGILGLALVSLLVPLIAKYAGMKNKSEKGFTMIGVGGVSLVLAKAFEIPLISRLPNIGAWGSDIFQAVGIILLLVGTLLVIYKVLSE